MCSPINFMALITDKSIEELSINAYLVKGLFPICRK